MTGRLLLDEMLSDEIAVRLRSRGHDVLSAVADPGLVALPDSALFTHATAERRAIVTRNIKDFVALDAEYRATGSTHGGLVLVSTKTFPEDRRAIRALIRGLEELLVRGGVEVGDVVFLQR